MSGKNPLGSGKEPQSYEGTNAIFPLNGFTVVRSGRDPTSSDKKYPAPSLWLNKVSGALWYNSKQIANWVQLSAGSLFLDALTADNGLAISPSLGNINILGTVNQIVTNGIASTIKFSLPAILIAPGSITATTSLTASLGNITATNGNLVLGAPGNKIIRSSVATTSAAGANSMGRVTLVGGTVTVSTTSVTTNSLIKIWRQSVGATGAAALGELSVGTIVNGSSFVIRALQVANASALQASDVSVIGWEIIN
jgi:hypothetical protein